MAAKHYLFICAVNQNRSRTAEHVCSQLAQAENKDIQCESAGIHPMAVKRVTKKMADRADIIFVMEDYMKEILETEFHQPVKKIICMDIPDGSVKNLSHIFLSISIWLSIILPKTPLRGSRVIGP